MRKEVVLTDDGSHTLHVKEIDECYHSTHGAVQESTHIFIDAGLREFLSGEKPEIRVLEIGFGTGLNAFLTLLEAGKLKKSVYYYALELYPLAADEAIQLNYPEVLCEDRELFEKIHRAPWGEDVDITSIFTLHKLKVDFTGYELPGIYDVIFFDAFSPEKQPEMWVEDGFEKIYEHSDNGTVITTYCAKGAVRRAMQSAGFEVERLPGPPGKREILRGRKIG
jgi:Uncharacterized conserved protein